MINYAICSKSDFTTKFNGEVDIFGSLLPRKKI